MLIASSCPLKRCILQCLQDGVSLPVHLLDFARLSAQLQVFRESCAADAFAVHVSMVLLLVPEMSEP
jgi:hypothetical protein